MMRVDHYLNAIKRSILQGTSKTSIDMSIKDEVTLSRLVGDVVPTETLGKIGKGKLAEVNARFDEVKVWVEETKKRFEDYLFGGGLSEVDLVLLEQELDDLVAELITGSITVVPYEVLNSYLRNGITYDGSLVSDEGKEFLKLQGGVDVERLQEACQLNVRCINAVGEIVEAGQMVTPFPITYMVFAEITEVELIGNTDRVPASANNLRARLGRNFERMLVQNELTPHQQMSLYRILGPERIQQKAAVEVTNIDARTQQQLVIVKDASKMKPNNLVVNDNAELLGVGDAYGNIDKSGLLRLAAGEMVKPDVSTVLPKRQEQPITIN